ncbi:MAG: rhodanese-like domain-containing protein [Deltaproteobacteria bacterium]|nr:rhodanese-like domain-containing protein [Deltaproteobacteria bacterium]
MRDFNATRKAGTETGEAPPDAIFTGPLAYMHNLVSTAQLKILLERKADLVLVNVLDRPEFAQEHIPGSINIPVAEIERIAPQLIKSSDLIVVYCRTSRCRASAVAADKLSTIGYDNVMRYSAGIRGWKAADLPVEGLYTDTRRAA